MNPSDYNQKNNIMLVHPDDSPKNTRPNVKNETHAPCEDADISDFTSSNTTNNPEDSHNPEEKIPLDLEKFADMYRPSTRKPPSSKEKRSKEKLNVNTEMSDVDADKAIDNALLEDFTNEQKLLMDEIRELVNPENNSLIPLRLAAEATKVVIDESTGEQMIVSTSPDRNIISEVDKFQTLVDRLQDRISKISEKRATLVGLKPQTPVFKIADTPNTEGSHQQGSPSHAKMGNEGI